MKGYKFCLIKAYFDKGLGLTNYIKYGIAFFGLASNDVKWTLIIALIYAIFCFILGYSWYKFKFIDAENEVSNRFNPFVKEMRECHPISPRRGIENIKNNNRFK